MKDFKEGTAHPEHGQWHRVCELSALPEQAGRSAWLEGRVLALFRLGEHVYALDGWIPWPASRCWGVAWWGMPVGSPWWPRRCTSSATP